MNLNNFRESLKTLTPPFTIKTTSGDSWRIEHSEFYHLIPKTDLIVLSRSNGDWSIVEVNAVESMTVNAPQDSSPRR